jgi:hypothetical protein
MCIPTLAVLPLVERVTAGAALLDRCQPGWATQVDPDQLDMAADYEDLLGQLYGDYAIGLEELSQADPARPAWPWSTFAYEHGFDLPADDPTTYPQLGDAWRAELGRRRRSAGAGRLPGAV